MVAALSRSSLGIVCGSVLNHISASTLIALNYINHPPPPSHFPSSPGSFFSVSFYYFASSSFSPLTSLHIIPALVAFSSSSSSRCSALTPFTPICFIFILPQSFPSSPAGSAPPSGSSFFSGSSTFSLSSRSFSLSLKSWANFWN